MTTFERAQALVASVLNKPSVAVPEDAQLVETGLDSISLLVLRERCEVEFSVVIPDDEWMVAGTFSELVGLIDRASGVAAVPAALETVHAEAAREFDPSGFDAGDMAEEIEIGMPLMGVGNLCENPLLKYLGDVRWRHITKLTGIASRDLVDDGGNRLYPAFFYVELRFPDSKPMGSFTENDRVVVVDKVSRFGGSILDGMTYLVPVGTKNAARALGTFEQATAAGIPAVRMSNAFVMKFDGAEWLKKSRPGTGVLDAITALSEPPDSSGLAKRVQQGESLGAPGEGFVPLHREEVQFVYAIQPDRDVNGVGLLYFANYPVFLDLAERDALGRIENPWSGASINSRSLIVRKLAYLNNASWRDAMEIRTRSWVRSVGSDLPGGQVRLATEQRMYRQSDGRMMCACWSEKYVAGTMA